MQKSRSFLFPIFNFSRNASAICGHTYLGHVGYEGINIWGNFFYIKLNESKLRDSVIKEFRNHERFVVELHEEDCVLYVFRFSDEEKEKVVQPFLKGAYSKIDREYAKTYFPKISPESHRISTNWRILIKDNWEIPKNIKPLRKYWEERIGIPIPKNEEVWPKPRQKDEIYGQYSDDDDVALNLAA